MSSSDASSSKKEKLTSDDVVLLLQRALASYDRKWGTLQLRVEFRGGDVYEVGIVKEETHRFRGGPA
ncbi:MAG: hypothetical protein GVY30_11845 [Chloroflexi bacterium]|nr:hypothetical protein [Chloroflexota bacterium]